MSQENVEIIRRGFEGFLATGELPLETIDPEIEIRDHDLPDAVGEVYRGHEGWISWLAVWEAPWEEVRLELEELIDAGAQVLAIIRLSAKGKGSGVVTERQNGIVYELRDGKVVRVDYFGSKEGALACAGVAAEQFRS